MMARTHFPNLDALRFLAFFSVFLFHGFWTNQPNVQGDAVYQAFHTATRIGDLGVNFFFVLSGFLISYLLMEEEEVTGKISVRNFYIRRVVRIWPLFYLITIGLILIFPLLYQVVKHRPFDLNITEWKYFLFLSNFDVINRDSTIPTLNTLWSISIEEQFYAVWPVLFFVFRKHKVVIPIFIVIVASLVFRLFHYQDNNKWGVHTLAVINDMAIGGLLAYWAFYYKYQVIAIAQRMPRWFIALVYVGLISFAYLHYYYFNEPVLAIFDRLIFSLFFAFVIFEQVYAKNSLLKMGRIKLFTHWGRITYGLYCYHYLCIFIALKLGQLLGWNRSVFGVVVLDTVVGFILSIIVATVSYEYFEKFFLKLKPGYKTKKAPIEAVPAP